MSDDLRLVFYRKGTGEKVEVDLVWLLFSYMPKWNAARREPGTVRLMVTDNVTAESA